MKYIALLLLSVFAAVFAQDSVVSGELNRIPFQKLIAGPLNAMIKAQAKAAQTTLQFLNDVAFETIPSNDADNDGYNDEFGAGNVPASPKQLKMITFEYKRNSANGTFEGFEFRLPFIYIVPIPFIEITEGSIELNVKLNSVDSRATDTSSTFKAGFSAQGSFWGISVKFSANVSNQNQRKTNENTSREYSTKVFVKVVQPPLPGGTARVLDLFETLIDTYAYNSTA